MAANASRGAYYPGAQGHSLAEAIDGSTPTGVSGEDKDPPPARCRWCHCQLAIRNRPRVRSAKKPKPADDHEDEVLETTQIRQKEIPEDPGILNLLVQAEVAGHSTGLVEAVKPPAPKIPKRSDDPDLSQLCDVHQRKVLDWHMDLSDERPPFYPPEPPDEPKAVRRGRKT